MHKEFLYKLWCGYSRLLSNCTPDLTTHKQTRFLILGTFTECKTEIEGKCKINSAQATDLFNTTKVPEPQIKEQANKHGFLFWHIHWM